ILASVPDALDPEYRVARPSVRRGWLRGIPTASTGRGEDAFIEMEWDDVLDLLAAELVHVRNTWGDEAVFGGSYGWSSAGAFHHAKTLLSRFLACSGGFTGQLGNYSFAASSV